MGIRSARQDRASPFAAGAPFGRTPAAKGAHNPWPESPKPTAPYPSRRHDGTTSGRHEPAEDEAEPRQKIDVHEAITQKIVAAIEAGAGTFEMPWHRPGVAFTIPKNASTDKALSRLQHPLALDRCRRQEIRASGLGHLQAIRRSSAPRSARARKARSSSSTASGCPKDAEDIAKRRRSNAAIPATDDDDGGKRLFAKAAWVFNIEQVDAPAELLERLLPAATPRPDLTDTARPRRCLHCATRRRIPRRRPTRLLPSSRQSMATVTSSRCRRRESVHRYRHVDTNRKLSNSTQAPRTRRIGPAPNID